VNNNDNTTNDEVRQPRMKSSRSSQDGKDPLETSESLQSRREGIEEQVLEWKRLR